MDEFHKLLKRQLKKYLGEDELPDRLRPLLNAISEAYRQQDDDRQLIERAFDLSSMELSETIQKLKETQLELLQREKMASIGQLSAGIAHEINNPLGYIISNMDTLNKYIEKYLSLISILKETNHIPISDSSQEYHTVFHKLSSFEKENNMEFINQDIKELIEDSLDGLNRIAQIVRGLRDFSRIDLEEDYVSYDINHGIQSTLAIILNSVKYNAQVILELSTVPNIQALGNEINQVILNLLINSIHAIKASHKQGILRISTYQDRENVILQVEDNGIGIPENNLIKIFDPFFTTKKVGEGTGLGLSISYDIIVNKHKGKIDVRSEIGKGTTFIIQLPIYRV
jgi:signal transduction histidine kinase